MAEEAKKIHINPSDVRLTEEGISYLWNHIKEFVKKRVPDAEETDATKFLRGDGTWSTIETDGTITGDGSASAKFSVQESLDDLYETIKAELSARAVFGYATKEALPVPGDPSKVYYVGPSDNVADAYDVYVWSTQDGTGEYVLVDESSISLEGYWHGEPTEEGDGNVVTGLVAEADGTVTVQKGITAVEKGSIVAGTDLVVEETEDGNTLVRVNTTGEATGECAFAEGGSKASGNGAHAEGGYGVSQYSFNSTGISTVGLDTPTDRISNLTCGSSYLPFPLMPGCTAHVSGTVIDPTTGTSTGTAFSDTFTILSAQFEKPDEFSWGSKYYVLLDKSLPMNLAGGCSLYSTFSPTPVYGASTVINDTDTIFITHPITLNLAEHTYYWNTMNDMSVAAKVLTYEPTETEGTYKITLDKKVSSSYSTEHLWYIIRIDPLQLKQNIASGENSHAEGGNTVASGPNSHSEGHNTTSSGDCAHAEGDGAKASSIASHAEGYSTIASGSYSHAEGGGTNASGSYSHAEGGGATASGLDSHAEGGGTTASGTQSHAEGGGSKAIGDSSHAEGSSTKASGTASHAEGSGATASGLNSHAEGGGTTASGEGSHAEGGGSKAIGESSHAEGSGTNASGSASHAEGSGATASAPYSHAEGGGTNASGSYSHAEGGGTKAIGETSHAEGGGTTASGTQSHAEGGGTNAIGVSSHAEGAGTTAGGLNSHSEGLSSSASGPVSHAEGGFTVSSNNYTHAEGHHTTASGEVSHAEGEYTVANAPRSHAEGSYTIAAAADQHVQGKFNVEDDTKAHIVGGGSSSVGRKNIHTLDWAGNAFFAGDITFNGNTSLTEALQHSGGGGGDIVAGEGLKKEGDTISVAYGKGLHISSLGKTELDAWQYNTIYTGTDYDECDNIDSQQIEFTDSVLSVLTIYHNKASYSNDPYKVAVHINTDLFGDITALINFGNYDDNEAYSVLSYPSLDGTLYLNIRESVKFPHDYVEIVVSKTPRTTIEELTTDNGYIGTITLVEAIATADVVTYSDEPGDDIPKLEVNVDGNTISMSRDGKLSAVEMVGATMWDPGKGGIVPSPDRNDQILTGNGKWSYIGVGLRLQDYSSGTGNDWITPEFTIAKSVTMGAGGEPLFTDIDLETPSSYSQVIGFTFTMSVESLPDSNILNVGMISSETGMLQATVTVNGAPVLLYGDSMPSSPPYMYAIMGKESDVAYLSFMFLETPIDESPYSYMPIDITFTNNWPIAISGASTGTSTLCAVEMSGAGSSYDGVPGIVPAPLHGDQDKFLRGDGTWATPAGGGGGSTVSTSYDDTTETVTIRIG